MRRGYIHPGFFMVSIANPIVKRLGLSSTLTVRGRRTGEPHTVPHGGPFEYRGARYLVSGRGETDWVRNLRAAGLAELRKGRATESFRAVEITGTQREEIVSAYRRRMGRSVEAYFERIPAAAGHPVFRMDSAEAKSS